MNTATNTTGSHMHFKNAKVLCTINYRKLVGEGGFREFEVLEGFGASKEKAS